MIMSGKYIYPANEYVESVQLEPTVLVEENVIVWEQQNDDCEETVDFVDANDTLTENINETYVSADGNNSTQYFSLDTSAETVLNDIDNVNISNSKINGTLCSDQDNNDSIDVSSHQVVLFRIDNSDDLYGVQVAQDEEGNFQKYQFKVRQNEEGNLEAVPESIQILPLDNDCDEISNVETADEEILHSDDPADEAIEGVSVFVKQEHSEQHNEDSTSQKELEEDEEEEEENMYNEHVDSKEGILEVATSAIVHKQEAYDPEESVSVTEVYGTENEHFFEQTTEDVNENLNEPENYYTNENINGDEEEEQDDEGVPAESSEHYEQLFVKESHLIEEEVIHDETIAEEISEESAFVAEEETHQSHNSESAQENINENDSDNDYEIAEGSHITGETDNHLEELQANNVFNEFEESLDKQSPKTRKLIKNVIRKIKVKKNNDSNKVANTFYLIKHLEKENLGTVTANVVPRPNPRSILKCSVTSVEPKKDMEEEKFEKRFAKSKEAQQARLFHNYIAQTKIIHAPIRQQRLPRKQQIKPMERTDEEIVVQEVVVCSNGFVETSEEGVLIERKSIKPTEYIQLSDSDEDYDPKIKHKRKRKHKKRKPQIEITISDSDEDWSDTSIIEIDASDSEEEEKKSNVAKRPRGRPPKNSVSAVTNSSEDMDKNSDVQDEHKDNNVKRSRGRPPKTSKKLIVTEANKNEDKMIIVKTNNKCPKCPKSFPSEGSLRTHMQYHNFKDSNTNLTNDNVNKNKYECNICGETFKNNFLLTRHKNSHNNKEIMTCTVCKKIFNDIYQLSVHKRMHVKQLMFKTTTTSKVSPKKFQQRKNSPKKQEFKCKDCSKILPNSSALMVHEKIHKKYLCSFCSEKFLSNLMLQNHIRQSCVKRKLSKKRLSFTSRKSFLKPPVRMSSRIRRQSSNIASTVTKDASKESLKLTTAYNIIVTNIKCDSCPLTFPTYTSLYKHKVIKHGLDNSDQSVKSTITPAKKYKPKGEHSGVPPSAKLKRAFKELRSKTDK